MVSRVVKRPSFAPAVISPKSTSKPKKILQPRPIQSDEERFSYMKAGKIAIGWVLECDNEAQAETVRSAYSTFATIMKKSESPYKGIYSSVFVRLPFPVVRQDLEAIQQGLYRAGIRMPDKVAHIGAESVRRAHDRFLMSKMPRFDEASGQKPEYATDFLQDGVTPLPFQEVAIEYVRRFGYRGVIGDDMGLGKTMSGICVLENAGMGRKLVVTKNSLTPSFYSRLKDWTGKDERNMAVAVAAASEPRKRPSKHEGDHEYWRGLRSHQVPFNGDINEYDTLIVHYTILEKWLPRLLEWKPDVVVFDEAHTLCNPDSKQSKAAAQIIGQTDSVVLMTGTPGNNRPRELYHLFNLVFPYRFGDFHHFGLRFCDAKTTLQPRVYKDRSTGMRVTKQVEVLDYDGASNLKELYYRLRATGMVRRLKKDVLDQIPYTDIPITLEVSGEYLEKEAQCLQEVREAETRGKSESLLAKLMRISAEEKIKWATEWIPDFLENKNGPLVVFFHHNSVGEALLEYARKHGIKTLTLFGQHQDDDFEASFQTDEEVELALISYSVGRDGLTLTRSAHMLLLEYTWVPGWLDQAKDRIRRIGQERDISYYCPYFMGSADEIVVDCVTQKKEVLSALLDNRADTVLPDFSM